MDALANLGASSCSFLLIQCLLIKASFVTVGTFSKQWYDSDMKGISKKFLKTADALRGKTVSNHIPNQTLSRTESVNQEIVTA